MLRFSESVSFDQRLAPFDIAGSKAHSAMLAHVGLITAKERDSIHSGLDAIMEEIASGLLAVPLCFLAGRGLRRLPGLRTVF